MPFYGFLGKTVFVIVAVIHEGLVGFRDLPGHFSCLLRVLRAPVRMPAVELFPVIGLDVRHGGTFRKPEGLSGPVDCIKFAHMGALS